MTKITDGNKRVDMIASLMSYAISADHLALHQGAETSTSNISLAQLSPNSFLRFKDLSPLSSYTFDLSSDDRLFGTTLDQLMRHPKDTIGHRKEMIMFSEGESLMKWTCLKLITDKRLFKGCSILGRPVAIYEYHYREVCTSGEGRYEKRLCALDKNGKCLPVKMDGFFQERSHELDFGIIILCGMIEDAHRAGSVLVSIKEDAEIICPVASSDYKEFFRFRDGPKTQSGRKKSILHWVCGHMRKSSNSLSHSVIEHKRGVDSFDVDGLKISIQFN